MPQQGRFFVAVTGAQGVGKSTFCRTLRTQLTVAENKEVTLLDELGDRVATLNVPLGSASNSQTIFAVWTTHLEREATAPPGLVLLDRCVIDALAYTRALRLGSELERGLFERVGQLVSDRLSLVVHLKLSSQFVDKGASHETPELRFEVARQIERVLREFEIPTLDLDAASPTAVDQAVHAVLATVNGASCA